MGRPRLVCVATKCMCIYIIHVHVYTCMCTMLMCNTCTMCASFYMGYNMDTLEKCNVNENMSAR